MIDIEKFLIFLDIDGVLVSLENLSFDEEHEHKFKEESLTALNYIINNFSADLCMLSSWNSKFSSEEDYRKFLQKRGINVNQLMMGRQHDRANFVEEMISHGLKNYLIIDDEAFCYLEKSFKYLNSTIEYKRIIRSNSNRCLDMHDAKFYCKWIKIINSN